MNSKSRIGIGFLSLLMVVAVAIPSLASDPATQDATVPTSPGEVVELTWTGTTLPGAEQSGNCQPATSDGHDVNLTVPAGALEGIRVTGLVDITYDGPATDLIVTLMQPDGTTTSGDSGFVDTDESVSFGTPMTGTYTVLVCAFLGAAPQAYDGKMTLTAEAAAPGDAVASGPSCLAPEQTLKFEMDYIDTTRAGGEPIVETLDDGTLLWGSHAGTTHFFGPAAPDPDTAAFIENYQGQTYQYFSEDDGETWEFSQRTPINGDPLAGVPASGFSDPAFTVDAAGNVFISEINLANVAISKSTDGGRNYQLQNVLSFTNSDRQWMAADEEDVVYMTANGVGGASAFPLNGTFNGHFIAKSVDGGVSFIAAEAPNPDGVADIQVDPSDGTLYELSTSGDGNISMAAFRDIRDRDADFVDGMELGEITTGAGYTGIGRLIDPTFDMDDEGNLYTVWTENGTGAAERPPGIYYSYSTDRGATWAQPAIRVDIDPRTDIWPWIAVGAPGQVAISYLQVDAELENNNAELAAEDQGWNVVTAHTGNGLGCGGSDIPGFQYTTSTSEPIHFGTICQGGTLCQTMAVDRRLGDYFANEIDGQGNVYISVSDTRQGGGVSLPLVVRQTGGDNFLDPVGGVINGCGVTDAADGASVRRVQAATAAGLSVALDQACFESSDTVLLARDDVFADALAGSGLAGSLDAPIMLTPTAGLDPQVAEELQRLEVSQVVLLGGTAALSDQVADDVTDLGITVDRIGGPERFSTADLISRRAVGSRTAATAIVALGVRPDDRDPWPDALASGVLSARRPIPVLLATPTGVPQVTIQALTDLVGEGGEVIVAGGVDAVGADAEQDLTEAGFTVRRLAGADRYGTAVAIVREALAQGASANLLVLASGESFQGPLVAAPASVRAGGVMLLVPPDRLPDEVAELIRERAGQIDSVLVVGDEATINQSVVDEVLALLAEQG
ncbi:MAG: cell wall-binding repeat-containing protein [Euzebya sp.]